MPLHPRAEAFDTAAPDYVRGRPDYPPALLDWLRDEIGLGPGASAADLGAGTGKFTRLLLQTGARVVAIEPVRGMREALTAAFPDLDVREGLAAAMPLEAESVQAVVCAQAFHWFATAKAMAEIRRVLAPGGRLALVWNTRDSRVPWVARIGEILDTHEGDTPRHADGAWRSVFPAEGFGPLHEALFAYGHTGDPEDVIIARVRSTSFIAALPPNALAAVEAQLRTVIADEPNLRDSTEVTFPYVTGAFWAEKLSGPA
jgi:SAM-dependent methyltransferase